MGKKLFAERLTKVRLGAGMTREQLADRSGLSVRGIIKWERGERLPGSEELAKLCIALGADCNDFHRAILGEDDGDRPAPLQAGRPPAPEPADPPAKPKGKKK
jgi:transcriptional regulator with XRE-family HTH domain